MRHKVRNESVSVKFVHKITGQETTPFVFDKQEFGSEWVKEAKERANKMCGLSRFENWEATAFINRTA